MQLLLTEDQTMLAESARNVVSGSAPLAKLRALREDALGFDGKALRQMGELGWTGIPIAEADGGLGLGLAELACLTEALGRGLLGEPFISSVVLAGALLADLGSAAQKAAHLAPLLAGEPAVAVAHTERAARFDPFRLETRAVATPDGFRLTGEKSQVVLGHVAKSLVVAARTAGSPGDPAGVTLFLVGRQSPGIDVVSQRRIDAAPTALVRFRDAAVPASAVLGTIDHGGAALVRAIDRATVATAAEMLGGMSEALERTVSYLKERKQFGVAIGSFQALKHRAARLFVEVELTRSAVMAAARASDEGAKNAQSLVSVAKARANDAYLLVANEAVQMHGGIGMTDEHDIGFFLKRARAAEMTFGDSAYHRDRFARLSGF